MSKHEKTPDATRAGTPKGTGKPYRTAAQKAEARATARRCDDGAWRSDAPFCLPGQAGEFVWDRSVRPAVPKRR
jgi:hypothetical protein